MSTNQQHSHAGLLSAINSEYIGRYLENYVLCKSVVVNYIPGPLRNTHVCIRVLMFSRGVCRGKVSAQNIHRHPSRPMFDAPFTHHSKSRTDGRSTRRHLRLIPLEKLIAGRFIHYPDRLYGRRIGKWRGNWCMFRGFVDSHSREQPIGGG